MAILHGSWLLQAPTKTAAKEDPNLATEPGRGCLFIWGETWRRLTPDRLYQIGAEPATAGWSGLPPHPLALTIEELTTFLTTLAAAGSVRLPGPLPSPPVAKPGRTAKWQATKVAVAEPIAATSSWQWQRQIVAVPSYELSVDPGTGIAPQHSAAPANDTDLFLFPWPVDGLCLPVEVALPFLNSLPLGSIEGEEDCLGGDLRYWSHLARWVLDLLARTKFLPDLELLADAKTSVAGAQFFTAHWQPLLDSGVDQIRLAHFTDLLPAACRMYQRQRDKGAAESGADAAIALDLPINAQTLIHSFLGQMLDAQVRSVAQHHRLAASPTSPAARGATPTRSAAIETPLREWLTALEQDSAIGSAPDIEGLKLALKTWTTPLQYRRPDNLFRTCLVLHPPAFGDSNWRLEYCLQASDVPTFQIDADTIWNNPLERLRYQGRTVLQPQETLLMGLGLASRLYPVIEPSLQSARPRFCSLTPLQAYEFIQSVAWRLQDSGLGVVLPDSLSKQGGWANRLGLKIQADTGKLRKGQRLGLQSLLNFRWELTIGGQTLSKAEFDRLVKLNMPLVEINGEWVELRPQDVKAAQAFFASRKDQTELSLEDALRISTGDTQMIERLPVVSFEASGALEDLINTLNGRRSLEEIATPASFRGELRPYQSRGVGWLTFLQQWGLGACLADDMGLGKTIQFIAFLLNLKEQQGLDQPSLLICPTSVLGNWEREVKKFGPSLRVLQHHGDQRARGKALAKAVANKDLVITSYALVHRDLKDLQTIDWKCLVLDEAQNVKNPEAKQSQAVRQLQAEFRIALTGTPVENRLSELWSIMDFLNPGYLGPRNFFQRRFATPIERYGDTDSLKTLRSLVQPFILRRLKTDKTIIQDLPAKQEMAVFCGLTTEQAALYQQVVDQSLAEIEASEGIQRKGMILALLVKLKQICNHPLLYLKSETVGDSGLAESSPVAQPTVFERQSGKLQRLQEMLEEVVAEGDRALIFTQFAEWGKLLKAFLEKRLGQETLFLYGSTPKKQREEMVERFQQDPQAPRLFILSLKAGGVGLNLTRANHVFHFDRWWNPAVENQATDRVFRIGQTRNVQVHKFVCNGTLEEKIHDLIESKKALAEQVVGTGESWLTELNTDQLRDLLLLDRNAIINAEDS